MKWKMAACRCDKKANIAGKLLCEMRVPFHISTSTADDGLLVLMVNSTENRL